MMKKKGQGSVFSGDVPAIIMIVLSIGFFLSSVYLALDHFNSSKELLATEAALVDAASVFLKENAKIRPSQLSPDDEFWNLRIARIEHSKGVQVYVELKALDQQSTCYNEGECVAGNPPPENSEVLSKRFPIALKSGDTDLEVYPALVKVSVYR